MHDETGQDRVALGHINGVFGVQGWVKVFSYTEPRERIVKYKQWLIKRDGVWQSINVISGRSQGKGVVARLEGITDRNAAELLMGSEIAIKRSELPRLSKNEFYWSDLIGLDVVNLDGEPLGQVTGLMETGAHDVLVVEDEAERLIPWVMGDVVVSVDTLEKRITVNWDKDF